MSVIKYDVTIFFSFYVVNDCYKNSAYTRRQIEWNISMVPINGHMTQSERKSIIYVNINEKVLHIPPFDTIEK